MNAGELGLGALGAMLQSALPALEAAGRRGRPCALVGADELSRELSVAGAASAEDCTAIVKCGVSARRRRRLRRRQRRHHHRGVPAHGHWPTCSRWGQEILAATPTLGTVFSLLRARDRGVHLCADIDNDQARAHLCYSVDRATCK